MKGACFEEAMAHLTGLGIREVSESIGAEVLGGEIREIIIQPFRELSPDQLCQGDLSEIGSPSVRGIETQQVETEGIRPTTVYGLDGLHCSSQESQVVTGIEQGEYSTYCRVGIVVTDQSEDGGAMTGGQAQATINSIFNVAIDSFMPTPEFSFLSPGYADADYTRAELSPISNW
jgi:hypothetical protein